MLSPMRNEELVEEVVRLRRMDSQRRKISEAAEAEARALKQVAHTIGQGLQEIDKSLEQAIEEGADRDAIDALQERRRALHKRLVTL